MAWEDNMPPMPGQLAGSDMSGITTPLTGLDGTGQYLMVTMNGTDDTHIPITANTQAPSGVLQNKPKSGGSAAVKCLGISKVMASATLVAGNYIGPDAVGRAIKRTMYNTGADVGKYYNGIVLEGATVGNLATAMIFPAMMLY